MSLTFASLSCFYIISYISQDFPFLKKKIVLSFRSFIIRCILSNGNLHIWSVVLKITTLYLNIPSFSHNSQKDPCLFFLFHFVPSLQNVHIRSTLFGFVSFISFVHSLSYTSSSYSLTQLRTSHVFYYNSISLPTDK